MIPQETKLLNMLSNNNVTFFIPPYQRNYEWTDEQCEVFLEDIVKTYRQNEQGKMTEHFFGTVVFFQTNAAFGQPNKLVLIDGQQRITTVMLFLVALRDICETKGIGAYIDSRYLKNNNVQGDSEYKVKLKQVETDWGAYKCIILGNGLTEKEKNSAVYRNYKYFYNKLSSIKDSGLQLEDLVAKGLDKFSVITIELKPEQNSWENPQEIFESMNSLGKPLSLADLVRNYLLLGLDADTQNNLYNKYWLYIEKMLPGKVSDFIRDFMQATEMHSFNKATESRYKELYGAFKKIFADYDPKDLLKELSDCATIYSYCLSTSSTGNVTVDKYLQDLNRLSVTTAYSFLLVLLRAWVKKRFTNQDLIDILDAFRIYCLRKRLIGITQAENKNFPQYAKWLPELIAANDKKAKMFDLLSKQESAQRLPNDIEISRYLATMNFYNFAYCKFYLALIEESLTKSRPDLSDTNLQIEHIMPRKLSDSWINELGPDYEDVHQELLNTIGNLTLIRHNQKLGNKSFDEKKVIYEENAGLQIARNRITNNNIWNATTIKRRTKWMTDYLLQYVIPIPDHMRKINNFNVKEQRGLSFQALQLIGLDIEYIDDPSIVAHVVSDKEVEFEGKKWKLSPLTREIRTRQGKVSASGAYQGAQYWAYEGIRLADIM